MFRKFLYLEWKQFFRSSYWQRSLAMNIFLAFLALYMLLNFLVIGVSAYFILKEKFPDKDPLYLINSFLPYWFTGDLIIRYLAQKLPEASVRPLLVLPVRKKSIARYILLKATFSFWVFLPLTAFVPFAAVLWVKGYDPIWVGAWLATVTGLTLFNNYLNYLINNNRNFFWWLIGLLLGFALLDFTGIFSLRQQAAQAFHHLKQAPWLALIPWMAAYIFYRLDYQNIRQKLYLDEFVSQKTHKISDAHLSFLNRFGETGIYLNNEIKKIWRSNRTKNMKQIIFAPLFGLFYIFLNKHGKSPEDMEIIFIFPAMYMLGMFIISYANYIPAWDSGYYAFIMSQKVNLKKYLEAKWLLLTGVTLLIFILSIPYLYFGWSYLAILFAVLIFNIGFLSWVTLWLGAYNTKPIDLDAKASFNTQGLTARNFITTMLILLIPMMITMYIMNKFGLTYALLFLIGAGLPGILFKEAFLEKISRKYRQRKYKMLHGFKQQS